MENYRYIPDPEKQVEEHFDSLPVLDEAREAIGRALQAIEIENEAQDIVDNTLDTEAVLRSADRILSAEHFKAKREERVVEDARIIFDANWGEFLSYEQLASGYFWNIIIAEEVERAKTSAGLEESEFLPQVFSLASKEGAGAGLFMQLNQGPFTVDMFLFFDDSAKSGLLVEVVNDERLPIPQVNLLRTDYKVFEDVQITDETAVLLLDLLRTVSSTRPYLERMLSESKENSESEKYILNSSLKFKEMYAVYENSNDQIKNTTHLNSVIKKQIMFNDDLKNDDKFKN